jgi:23S rRNA pseudouridine1911/1915/1917 synthase
MLVKTVVLGLTFDQNKKSKSTSTMIQNKTRLHKVLSTQEEVNESFSKPEISAYIEKYGVVVNGKMTHKRLEWVLDGIEVDFSHWPKKDLSLFDLIKVLQEGEDYMLVYKPVGLPVQPGAGHKNDTLLNWLFLHYPYQAKLMENAGEQDNASVSAGIVNRLDKDTQGIIMIAKTLEAHKKYQDEFRGRNVIKEYVAVVKGYLQYPELVEGYQCRDRKNPIRQRFFTVRTDAFEYDEKYRDSSSLFTLENYCSELDQSIVKVQIFTGRMHQIRLHAQSIGHELVADPIYTEHTQVVLKPETFEKVLSKNEFFARKDYYFGETEFCLLSNKIKILDISYTYKA